jgi:hypothetical protein
VKEIFCRSGECLSLSIVDPTTLIPPASTIPPAADSSQLGIYCFHAAVRSPGSVPDLVGRSPASQQGKDAAGELSTISLSSLSSSSCSYSYFPPIPNRQHPGLHVFPESNDGAVGSSSSGSSRPAEGMASLSGPAGSTLCLTRFLVERSALPTLDTPQATYQPPPQRPPSSRGAAPNRRRVHRSDSESDTDTDSDDSGALEVFNFFRDLRNKV